jgi:hypothetical protein
VTLFSPFLRKRLCLEWVFFIDAIVLLLTLIGVCFTVSTFSRNGEVPGQIAVAFFAVLTTYVAAKAVLRMRAGSLAPDALSLIPSALCPWHFFAVVNGEFRVRLFRLNAITGERKAICEQVVFDAAYAGVLAGIPEFVLMRGLSPAYHVVNACQTDAGELVLCRDLRTRNFGTTFGDLEVLLDSRKCVKRINFHV